jgi:hypothetical protein
VGLRAPEPDGFGLVLACLHASSIRKETPLSTTTAAKPHAPARDTIEPHRTRSAPRRRKSAPSVYARYTGAMLYFMGAALIAGGVVHLPLDPPRYTVITAIGVGVFLLGTVVNEFVLATERPTVARAVWVVSVSLVLSFGVGILGGGLQHFEEFPHRGAVMTPIGLLMSYVAYVAKDQEGGWRKLVSGFGAGVVVVAFVTWLGMSAIADSLEATGSGHTHGSHATSTAETGRADDPGAQDPAASRAHTGGESEHEHGSHHH